MSFNSVAFLSNALGFELIDLQSMQTDIHSIGGRSKTYR